MFNNNFSFNNSKLSQKDAASLIEVANKGIEFLYKNVDEAVFSIWDNYAKNIIQLIENYSAVKGMYIEYLKFQTTILSKEPRDKLRLSIEKLIEIAGKY